MSKRDLFLERCEEYLAQAKNTNVFVKPTKKVDSGLLGKLFEMQVKKTLGCVYGRNVSLVGRTDTRKNKKAIEIKQGCSELEILFSNKRVDYVIYSPDFLPDDDIEAVAYVLTKEDFLQALEENNLIRLKKSSSGAIIHTIQTYKNSRKKYHAWIDSLDNYGMTISEFLEKC